MSHSPEPLARDDAAGLRLLKRSGLVFVIAAVLIVAWSLLSSQRASARLAERTEAQAAVGVATTRPQPMTEGAVLTLPGSVQANTDAPIYARTSGYLRSWKVDIGAAVKAGDVLAEIDAPELDQQLHAAEAELADVRAAQQLANLTAERWRGLRETDSVSKQAADEKIALAQAGDAQLKASQANLQRLRELSGFKRIVAPFDGVVTARNTDVGQLIVAGSASGPELFRIAAVKQLRLYVRVPQAQSSLVKLGLKAQVRFPDRPGRKYEATVVSTSGALESTSRTLLAQLAVDNAAGELLPGSYAEVRFELPGSAEGGGFRLPANVLLMSGSALQVATVKDGKVVMKPVTMGRDFGGDIEIVGGLAADDDVVLSPPDSMSASTTIRVVQPAQP
ncbi:MAG: efflux RND transporter periplasmic adaptor subunit [Steroidobacteraceae bacterium]